MLQRCDQCSAQHRKCDGASPACSHCTQLGKACSYTSSSPATVNKSSPLPTGSACSACRTKKKKCDRTRPVCGPCKKRGVDCVYGSSALRRPSKKLVSSRLSANFVNDDNEPDQAETTPKFIPPSSPVHKGERKSLSAERKDVPARRTSTGSFMSSMRAATSSISDSVSERGEKELESDRPRKFPRLTPSSANVQDQDRNRIGAEEKDQSVVSTSEAASSSSASTTTPTGPGKPSERGEEAKAEPTSSRPSSHQENNQTFFTPEPQPNEEAETSDPSALPKGSDYGESPVKGSNPSSEGQSDVETGDSGFPTRGDLSGNETAGNQHQKESPEPQFNEAVAEPAVTAFPDEHRAREIPNDMTSEEERELRPDESSGIPSDSEIAGEAEDVQMRDAGQRESTVSESRADEDAEVTTPLAIANGDVEQRDYEDKENETGLEPQYHTGTPIPSHSPPLAQLKDWNIFEEPRRVTEKDLNFVIELERNIRRRTGLSKPDSSTESVNEIKRLGLHKLRTIKKRDVTFDAMALPDREHADLLVSEYLKGIYVCLPILDLPYFQDKYQAVFSGEETLEDDVSSFPIILNIVFALGSLMHPAQLHSAETYFARAEDLSLAQYTLKDVSDIQAQILLSQYLVATNDLPAAWSAIDNAIRVAQSLWLHIRPDRELCRRLWYGCVVMERIIATHLGAAPQVTRKAFNLNLPTTLEEDYAGILSEWGVENGAASPSIIIDFFAALAQLYERREDIVCVEDAYLIVDENNLSEMLEDFDGLAILIVDRRLCDWKASLPWHLALDTTFRHDLQGVTVRRQNYMLRIKYLHMRLQLWRPLLALTSAFPGISKRLSFTDGSQMRRVDTPLSHALIQEGAVKCLLAASEMIHLISSPPSDAPNSTGYWWENIEYIFSCATVFLAARLGPLPTQLRLREMTCTDLIQDGWTRSVQFLEEYRSFSPVAEKCLSALEPLAAVVLEEADEDPYEERIGDWAVRCLGRDMVWLNCLPADIPE